MQEFDDAIVKKMDALLKVLAETEKTEAGDDELLVDDLDMVTGGVAVPNFQQFLKYANERREKENKSN